MLTPLDERSPRSLSTRALIGEFAVEKLLIRVGIARQRHHLHRSTTSDRTPTPKAR